MDINHLLAIGSVAAFPVLLLTVFKHAPRKFYVLYVLYLFPVMDLAITPVEWGRLRVFDIISYMYLAIMIKEFARIRLLYLGYSKLFVVFLLVTIFGSISSLYIRNSIFAISAIFPVFIFGKSLLSELSDNEFFEKEVINCLQIVALVSVAFVVAQMLVGLNFTFYPALNRNTISEEGITRYPSFFHDPQMYGQYLVLVCHLFFINDRRASFRINLTGKENRDPIQNGGSLDIVNPNYKNYIFFAIIMFALLQTGGRSALIAVFVGLLFLSVAFGRRYRASLFGIIGLGIVGYLFFSSSVTVFNRVENMGSDLDFREALWEEAKGIVRQYPLFGVGFGNFKFYNMDHTINYAINEEHEVVFFGYGQPESGYWMILTETGILGFITFFLFILTPIYTSIKSYIKGNRNLLLLILIAGILSWMVAFISAYSLHDKRVLLIIVTFTCILMYESKKIKGTYTVTTAPVLS